MMEVDPREQCLTDFMKWIKEQRESGEKVVVLTDANQTVMERTTAYSLSDLLTDCQMRSTLEDAYPEQSLWLLDLGSKTIDHILTAGIGHKQVSKIGKLPFGLIFSSNHRAMFADLKANKILQLCMEEPVQREGRRLISKTRNIKISI